MKPRRTRKAREWTEGWVRPADPFEQNSTELEAVSVAPERTPRKARKTQSERDKTRKMQSKRQKSRKHRRKGSKRRKAIRKRKPGRTIAGERKSRPAG